MRLIAGQCRDNLAATWRGAIEQTDTVYQGEGLLPFLIAAYRRRITASEPESSIRMERM